MADRSDTHIEARIAGAVSGQVAVGRAIHQVQSAGGAGPVTPAERAEVRARFSDLEARIAAAAPGDLREGAAERLAELRDTVMAEEPNAATIRYVTRWFARKLPEASGLLRELFAAPVVGRLVEAAEEGLAAELRGGAGR